MRIKRKYYSGVSLDERQFGFNENLLRAKRKGQVVIGKARVQLADKLMESAKKDSARNKKAGIILKKYDEKVSPITSITDNKSIARGLFKESRSNGGRIFPGDPDSSSAFIPKTKEVVGAANKILKEGNNSRLDNSIAKHILDPKTTSMIFLSNNKLDSLAHEIGHQSRFVSKNPISRHAMNTSESFNNWARKKPIQQNIKTDNVFDMAVKSGSRLLEERGATKKGLGLLKQHGATDEQLLRAKRLLGVAGSTYESSVKSSMKGLLSDYVQIPSRRRASVIERKKASKINTKQVTVPSIKTTPQVATPMKPVSTKPITPIQRPTLVNKY